MGDAGSLFHQFTCTGSFVQRASCVELLGTQERQHLLHEAREALGTALHGLPGRGDEKT